MHSSSVAQENYDGLSSPDPLASSESPACDQRKALSTKRIQSSATTRKQRSSSGSAPIFMPSSPSRTITEQILSPWKIRVTVEAEPEGEGQNLVQTMTRTMKVPLREEPSPAQVKKTQTRSQSRSRGSSGVNRRQRSVTPTTERRRRQSVTDLDIIVLGDDAEEDEWSKKQKKISPKKTRAKKSTPKQKVDAPLQSDVVDFEVRTDTDVDSEGQMVVHDESPELRQIDLNRVSVRARSNSTKQKAQLSGSLGDEGDADQILKPLPNTTSMSRRTVSANSAMTYPTPSPTASERGRSVEVEEAERSTHDHAEGFDTIMESEGFTMIDLDTIPSVRQMLSSPAECQASESGSQTKSPTGSDSTVRRHMPKQSVIKEPEQSHRSVAGLPHLTLPEDESEISSTLPSSPPTIALQPQPVRQKSFLSHLQVPAQPRNRQVTPQQPFSSPKLPSPPRQPTSKDRSSPDSAKAMRAALVLQGAVQPLNLYPALPPVERVTPKEQSHVRSSSEELFDGFDSGTKRELRAGLRFGEELAKRQASNFVGQQLGTVKDTRQTAQIWRGDSVMSRTPVQGISEQDQAAVLQKETNPIGRSSKLSTPSVHPGAPQYLDTEARREREWQAEREAVSKQIQEASPSKVVVIDSDDESSQETSSDRPQDQLMEDVTMGGADIWLEEARDSSSPRQDSDTSDLFVPSQRHQQPGRVAQFGQSQHRALPSPGRRSTRSNQVDSSTIMTSNDDMSGMLWRQSNDYVPFGAAAINNVRKGFNPSGETGFKTRRTSGTFDVSKMIGTPQRIREKLDKEPDHHRFSRFEAQQQSEVISDPETEEAVEDDEYDDETSHESIYSDESEQMPQPRFSRVPVNFNDTTLLQSRITPPQSDKSRAFVAPSTARPPTPRSAMKGTRQSFGAAMGQGINFEAPDTIARRVIFAERSKGVNIDWVENSSSLRSSTEDEASSPIVEHQKHHEERQLIASSSPGYREMEIESVPVPRQDETVEVKSQDQTQPQSGWLGWLWKNKQPQSKQETEMVVQVDGTTESGPRQPPSLDEDETETDDQDRAVALRTSAPPQHRSQPTRPSHQPLPTYLLPPSYPSDPSRDPSIPLSTSGSFTNTHFRTLHILHRKSQRPRFHAPSLQTCRPQIRDLVSRKWKLEVDESDAGLGGFAWTVGDTEAKVLERFCREVEFGYLTRRVDVDEGGEGGTEREMGALMAEWTDPETGIWSGNINHGEGDVSWGWTVTQLATWLGRVVVGEVVRMEEFGGTAGSSGA